MTISGHDRVMKVKISDLKARLSAYLRRVRRGETVVVLDRATPVARIVPLGGRGGGLGLVPAEKHAREIAKVRGVKLKRPVDADRILADSRGER